MDDLTAAEKSEVIWSLYLNKEEDGNVQLYCQIAGISSSTFYRNNPYKTGEKLKMEKQAIKTFNNLVISYLSEDRFKELSPVTLDANKRYLQNNVCNVIGRKNVNRISEEDALDVLARMRGKGLSESTIRTIYGLAKRVCGYGVQVGVMEKNPFALIDPGIQKNSVKTLFLQEDISWIKDAFEQHRLGNLFGLVLECGLSRSEVLGLMWEDVDFNNRTIVIRREYVDEVGNLILRDIKREKVITINRDAEWYLLSEKGAQQARRNLKGVNWTGLKNFVFTDDEGYPLRPDYVSYEMGELRKELHIPGLNLRNLKAFYDQRFGL